MTGLPDAPADTRIMGVVHDALRRDLARTVDALTATPHPSGSQRVAIARHVGWMVAFLRSHHHGEDAGLWPLMRARDPGAGPLVDALEADHVRVAPLLERCEQAAARYGDDDTADSPRAVLLDAVRCLGEVLLPHLEREEAELLPRVSVAVADAEWRALEKQYNIDPKSVAQLGFEGHWLLDGLDPERRLVVVHLVPPIPRFVLVHGFARRYRRWATGCWGPAGRHGYGPAPASARTIPRSGHAEVVVPAPVDAVWAIVSDVTRVGEWSHECRRVEWLGGATEPAPGVRFRGTNRAGMWRWSRVSEVVVTDPPRTFSWRTVPTPLFPDSSEWRIDLEPAEGGTRITQTYKVVRAPAVLARLYAIVVPSHRDRRTDLADDLRRLGQLADHTAREQLAS